MDLGEGLTRVAISHILAVYNNAADHGRFGEVTDLFTEDGRFRWAGGDYQGREQIAAFLGSVAEASHGSQSLAGSRHHITTSRIEMEGEEQARGWVLFVVLRRGLVIQHGLYIDRYRRIGGNWLIEERRVKLDYDGPQP